MKFIRDSNSYKALKIGSYGPILDKEIRTWLKDMAERNISDPTDTYFDLSIDNYKKGDREIDILNTFCEKWTPTKWKKLEFQWRHDMSKYMDKIGLGLRNHPSPQHTIFAVKATSRLI